MSETLSIKMLYSPETTQEELDEFQMKYYQEEIGRLEGVIIPSYPPACHITNGRHLHGCDQKVKHVSDTDDFKRLELTGESTVVDLVKAPFSDIDSQIRGVQSRTHFEHKIERAIGENNFQSGFRVKSPTNIQFFAD